MAMAQRALGGFKLNSNFLPKKQATANDPNVDPYNIANQGQKLQQMGGQSMQMQMPQGQASAAVMPPKQQAPQMPGSATNPTQPLSWQGLNPYMGSQGKVKVDPMTGQKIAEDQRQWAGDYLSQQLTTSPAIQEAMNFQFKDLPPEIASGAGQSLIGAGQGMIGQGSNFLGQGNQNVNDAIGNLIGQQGKMNMSANDAAAQRQMQLEELNRMQKNALAPDLDPDTRALLQQQADQRRAEVDNISNDLGGMFNRGVASDAASLAARGILDSTTAGNVIGRREADLGIARNQLLRDANEQSRQELMGERKRVGDTSTQFGNLRGLQAQSQGDLLASLLGQQATVGQNIGNLGLGQAGIGSELNKIGVSGIAAGGDLGLNARGQEADMQMAELAQKLLGSQTALQNIESYKNNKLGRKQLRQQMRFMNSQMQPQKENFGFWNAVMPWTSWIDQKPGER